MPASSRAIFPRVIRAFLGGLAERVAVYGGASLSLIAQQGQAKRRSFAACGDGHLRGRRGIAARQTLIDGLEHDSDGIELQLKAHSLGQVPVAELVLIGERQPEVAVGGVDDEAVAGGLYAQAEITALEQRPLVQDVDEALDAAAFLIELRVPPGRVDREHGNRDDDVHDNQHHQDLDEREALAAHRAAPRGHYRWLSEEALMSAS